MSDIKFSWFPGHMQKTMRKLREEEKMASLILVVLDARCPLSSRNPSLESIFSGKPIIYILNKADLASVNITELWLKQFKADGVEAVALSCKTGTGRKKLFRLIDKYREKHEKERSVRRRSTVFRIVVIGIPNSGKSSVINLLSPDKSVKTGKKPGLTRGNQWLKVKDGVEVLDSPGVMPPRMDMEDTPWILGTTAAIKQEILPAIKIASGFITYLLKNNLFPENLINGKIPSNPENIIKIIARERGFLRKGGIPDLEQASLHLLKIYREGKIGRISLEKP